ncbi:MAG TPA: MerR family transcriptional regulator [Candidatus Eisenbacteria bacterium]|nr:MerR family transcriptional regulator [Candidatus Eisenbacteria bacterium]
MAAGDRPIYSIGAVAQMLDVPPATLRAWEERYGVVTPQRGPGTHRLYTPEQVEQLRYVKGRIEDGLSAADAHRLLEAELLAGRDAGEPGPGGGERPVVLIAERDPYAAELAGHLLEREGLEVGVALDARRARAAFAERQPRVVVIDLLISGGAGLRLCRELAETGTAHLLAVSALASAEEALHAGASAFLQKPLEPLRLVAAVRDLLRAGAPVRRTPQPASSA